MTVADIARELGAKNTDPVRLALEAMPDAYVDRWDGPTRGQFAAVWCVVVPPPNCPHPTRQD